MPGSLPHIERNFLLVGGAFDETGGRPSGYFRKFAAAFSANTSRTTQVINGGSYADLVALLDRATNVTHLFWFADIPNELPKILPELRARFPALTLVQSKNNRPPREYTREQLIERMRASGSQYLLEFTLGEMGNVLATLLSAEGVPCFEGESDIEKAARATANVLDNTSVNEASHV
jgi:hypothetical protein